MIFVARRITYFQLSGMFSQTVPQILVFFSIREAKRSRFFSIKDFSFCSFVSPSKTTKDFNCVFRTPNASKKIHDIIVEKQVFL